MPFAKRHRGLEISRDIQTKCSKSTCPTLRCYSSHPVGSALRQPVSYTGSRISAQLEVGVATGTCQITWLAGKSGGMALYRNYSCVLLLYQNYFY
eukprot:sb/3479298/